jgi:hypothetical protein
MINFFSMVTDAEVVYDASRDFRLIQRRPNTIPLKKAAVRAGRRRPKQNFHRTPVKPQSAAARL